MVKKLVEALLALALVAGWAAVALQADRAMAGPARAAAPTAAGSGDAPQAHLAALFGHRTGEQLDQRVDGVDVRRGRAGQAAQLHH